MKKLLLLLLAAGVLFVSGCAKSGGGVSGSSNVSTQPSPAVSSAQNTPSASLTQIQPSPAATQSAQKTPAAIAENSFFFKTDSSVMYKIIYSFDDSADGEATLQVKKIAAPTLKTVYELKLDPIEGVPDDRLSLGYFYVLPDKIVRTDPTEENLNLLRSDKLPDGNEIVCQDKEMKDALGEDQKGIHRYIKVNRDQRECHAYNDSVETGQYEDFTWEKGKGLVAYRSGYDAEKDSIELQLNN